MITLKGIIKEPATRLSMGIVTVENGEELYFESNLYYNLETTSRMKSGDRVSFKVYPVHGKILRPVEFYFEGRNGVQNNGSTDNTKW